MTVIHSAAQAGCCNSPYYNLCEVVVCWRSEVLELRVIGYWVDRVNWDMVRLSPLVIPLDENGKGNHAVELQLLVSYTYGRLLAMSSAPVVS